MIAVFVLYALCFFVLPEKARNIFFYQVVPIYTWGNEWSAKCAIHMICSAPYGLQPFINFITALFLALTMRAKSPWLMPLAMFSCAAFFNYFQGGQSWTYRLLPMAFGAYMLYGIELGIVLKYILQRFSSLVFIRLLLAMALLASLCYTSMAAAIGVLAEGRDSEHFDLTQVGPGLFWHQSSRLFVSNFLLHRRTHQTD